MFVTQLNTFWMNDVCITIILRQLPSFVQVIILTDKRGVRDLDRITRLIYIMYLYNADVNPIFLCFPMISHKSFFSVILKF